MKYNAKDLALAGLFGALGIVIPMLFHLVGLGKTFLPMHLPILMCGLLVSPIVALVCGMITPLASGALTSMPPIFPIGVIMSIELGILAFSASIFYKKLKIHYIPAIILAMICARIAYAIAMLLISPFIQQDQSLKVIALSILASWPGIVVQLLAIPAIMAIITKKSTIEKTEEEYT
ncbi:MAG: ECF transporter S component [Armatimonadota bacterium]